MDGKLIAGVDLGTAKDVTAIGVVLFDNRSGVSKVLSIHENRIDALAAMKVLHARYNNRVPYHLAVNPDGSLKQISDLFKPPKTAMELLARCER